MALRVSQGKFGFQSSVSGENSGVAKIIPEGKSSGRFVSSFGSYSSDVLGIKISGTTHPLPERNGSATSIGFKPGKVERIVEVRL